MKKKSFLKILIPIFVFFSLLLISNIFVEHADAISGWDGVTLSYQYLADKFNENIITGFLYNPDTGYLVGFSRTTNSPTYNGSYIYAWLIDKDTKTFTQTDEQKIPYHYNTGIYDVTYDGTYYHFGCRSRIMAYNFTAGVFNLECDQAVLSGGAVNEGCHAIDNNDGYIFYGDDGGLDDGRLVACVFNGTAYSIVDTTTTGCNCTEGWCSSDDIVEIECDDFRIYVSRSANSCPTSVYDFDTNTEQFVFVNDKAEVSYAQDSLFTNGEYFVAKSGTFRSGAIIDGVFEWIAYGTAPASLGTIYGDASDNIFFVSSSSFSSSYSTVYYYDYVSSTIERIAVKGETLKDGAVVGFNDNIFTNYGMITYGTGHTFYMIAGDFNYPYVQVSNQMSDGWWNLCTNVTNLFSAFGNVCGNGTVRIWNGTYTLGADTYGFTSVSADRIYNDYATVWGNGTGSGDDGNNTEITDDIDIYGNHNTFYNLNFSGEIITQGTNNYFVDCVFVDTVEVYGTSNYFLNCTFYVPSPHRFRSWGHNMYYENCTFYGNDYPAFWINGDNAVVYTCNFISGDDTEDQKVVELSSSAYNNSFTNCVVTAPDDDYAFYLSDSEGNNTLYNCSASDMTYGFTLAVNDNAYYCTASGMTYGFVATGNINDRINISGCNINNCTYGIDTGGYINIIVNDIVDNSEYGIKTDVGYINISGNHFINNNYAMFLYQEDNNIDISYNNFSLNNYGIYSSSDVFWKSNKYLTINNNTFWSNVYWDTYFYCTWYTDITCNTFYGNGTYLDYSHMNKINDNVYWNQTAVSPSIGICFIEADLNNFSRNHVIDYDKGIYINGGETPDNFVNEIYNNYLDNTINAHEDHTEWYSQYFQGTYTTWYISPTLGTNIVGGPYIAGNYWSDYYGCDTDGDYIGDTNTPHNSSGYILGEKIPSGSYVILRPDGTGIWEGDNFSDFTPYNGGDNYAEVDEEIFDENVSYVYSDNGEEIDAYSLENFSGNMIWNVSFHAMARATENECIVLGTGWEHDQLIYSYSGSGISLTEEWTETIEYFDNGACFDIEGCFCYDWMDKVEEGSDTLINESLFILANDAECSGAEFCEPEEPSTLYVSQVWVQVNLVGWNVTGDEYPLVFFPVGPTNVTAEINGTSYGSGVINITINWTKAVNADVTVIVRNESGYAISWTNGTEIYNSTGNTTNTPIMFDHYYTLFGYNSTDNTFSYPAFLEFGAVKIECFNESNISTGLIFDILFKNETGPDTYYAEDQENIAWFDYSWIPHDTEVKIKTTSGPYRERTLIYYLTNNVWTHLIIYLNHGQLYYIKVIDELDYGIDDVKVTVSRFLNSSFQVIASDYTDPYGMMGVYLMPQTEYMADFYKNGYNNLTETFDTDPYYYGYNYPIIFRLSFSSLPAVDTDELFTNITWSLEPVRRYWNTSFTIFFNISSSDNILQYFSMNVYYVNTTTGVDDLLFSETNYTAAGGSISYTVENNSGKYKADCYFKKTSFPETDVAEEGSRIYFISWGGLYYGNLFENIPAWLFFAIIIILAAVITAFLFTYAGIGSGYVGLGVITFGLVLKPDVVIGDVSGWAILAITALIYTIGILLWSRI